MSTKQLTETITDGGIHLTNFFNGRLLTAEDLLTEQTANRQQHQQLGRAIGEGIITGLQVEQAASTGAPGATLTVSAGLALNRQGQVLSLPVDTDVALVPAAQQQAADAGLFATCEPPQSMLTPTGKGVYILVLSPASGFEGRAQMSGLSVQGVVGPACGSKYAVEGVQFGLVALDVNNLPGISDSTRSQLIQLMLMNDAASLSKLRNLLAYACFGTETQQGFFSDPFQLINGESPYIAYGALDALRSIGSLTDCDVPLALLYWTLNGIQFVDAWSVRRRLIEPAVTAHWPLLLGDRRAGEAEAMFLQFEEQIHDIRTKESNLASLVVTQRFAYLPPVGLLPIVGSILLPIPASGSPVGFDVQTFFSSLASQDVALTDGNLLRSLQHEALYHEPIDLSTTTRIQLYLIWENIKAIEAQKSSQLALVFASHTLPYQGVARFGYAHWHLSRFAPLVI